MQRLNQPELDAILELGHERLLKLAPHDSNRNGSVYGEIHKVNPDYYYVVTCLSDLLSSSKKRAIKLGMGFDLSLRYLTNLWLTQKGRCAISDVIMSPHSGHYNEKNPYRISIDRVNNNLGYVKGNVRLLTHFMNNAKSTWDDDLLFEFAKGAVQKRIVDTDLTC